MEDKLDQILLNQIFIMQLLLANDGNSVFVVSDNNAEIGKRAINLSCDLVMKKG